MTPADARDLRMPGERGAPCVIHIDGREVDACEGEPVAAAVLAAGARAFRLTDRDATPRAYYCGMGVCHECLMIVDGRGHVRTCMEPVRPGMRVETQSPRRAEVVP